MSSISAAASGPAAHSGLLASFLFLVLLSSTRGTAAADGAPQKPVISDGQCDCFMTNGSNSHFFAHHRFYDFRSMGAYVGSGPPALPSDPSSAASAELTSSFFAVPPFANDFAVMRWNNSGSLGGGATVLMVNSPANLYFERNNGTGSSSPSDTYLVMRTARHTIDFQSAAELESMSQRYRFLSIRMLARTVGAPGACTAVFTYRGARHLAGVQEADIEILTRGPTNRIQYTNQPSLTTAGDVVPDATVNATVPVDWTQWAVHRLDWTPSKSTWYVNDHEVASISFQTPREASHVNINSWSDGGVWTGAMDVGKQASLHIQWLEIVFNSTAPDSASSSSSKSRQRRSGQLGARFSSFEDGGKDTSPFAAQTVEGSAPAGGNDAGTPRDRPCKTVCSIDEAPVPGLVVMVANGSSQASRLLGEDGRVGDLAGWLPLLATLAALVYHLLWM